MHQRILTLLTCALALVAADTAAAAPPAADGTAPAAPPADKPASGPIPSPGNSLVGSNDTRPEFCRIQLPPPTLNVTKPLVRRGDLDKAKPLAVDVYMHVLARPEENKPPKKEFLLTRPVLDQQMKVLNDDFKSAKISFNLKGVNYTEVKGLPAFNDDISKVADIGLKNPALASLRKGKKEAVNVYFFNANDEIGGSTGLTHNKDGKIAGIIVNSNTVPGGASKKYNKGRTLSHEVGHYFGYAWHDEADALIDGEDCQIVDICITAFTEAQNTIMYRFLEKLIKGQTPDLYAGSAQGFIKQ
ncbi:hypothetical protein HIM_09291 [Hirsutella minnesotensis 3608]|uniref:Peptidase M43 pregnancy-associated plasma-A domain-containing protein n=1 Tax=Hirsutella minnesotensis 3608 TaxID=1043627 RepID=A0A0F7ZXU2_9HYPO|nr:hypothetical protein HIM_09291 [Hirsutella minnesotensis 3608]